MGRKLNILDFNAVKVKNDIVEWIREWFSKNGEGTSARTLVKVELETGRFHQIRAQLSSRSTPIVGDKKYGSRDFRAHTPSLFASRVAFSLDGEEIDISAIPDVLEYPWSNFAEEIMNLYPNAKGI